MLVIPGMGQAKEALSRDNELPGSYNRRQELIERQISAKKTCRQPAMNSIGGSHSMRNGDFSVLRAWNFIPVTLSHDAMIGEDRCGDSQGVYENSGHYRL